MKLGATYKMRDRHLWVVASLPAGDGSVVVLMFTTLKGTSQDDLNCVIKKGDHPFVHHDTTIAYEKATIISAANQKVVLQSPGLMPEHEPVSAVNPRRVRLEGQPATWKPVVDGNYAAAAIS